MDAREVAVQLARTFMESGQYNTGLGSAAISGVLPASSDGGDSAAVAQAYQPFAGLAVQAVGYEKGAAEERVHVYTLRGSKKATAVIPSASGDIKIEVNRMGALSVRPESAQTVTNVGRLYVRHDRIACGSSCAPTGETYSGTVGALVRKKGSKQLYVLSNNHVLAACNHVPAEMPVMSPSMMDVAAGGRSPREICRHSAIVELRSGVPPLVEPCFADAALGLVRDNGVVSSWQGDDVNGYDTPKSVVEPIGGLRVKKFGRTTGLTLGVVESTIPSPMMVTYKSKHFQASVWFRDIWNVLTAGDNPFALPGDSGSLIVTEDGEKTVGLLFAASPSGHYGWMLPISTILDCFDGISLVSGHGVAS